MSLAPCMLVVMALAGAAWATSPYDMPYGVQWVFMNGNYEADMSWSGNIEASPDGTVWIQTSGTGKTGTGPTLTWGNPTGMYGAHYASGYAQIGPTGVIMQGQDHPALPISNYNQGYPSGLSMRGTTAYICIYPGKDTTWNTVPGDVGASGNPFSWSVDPVAAPQGAPYTGTLGAMFSHDLLSKGGRTHDMAVDSNGNMYFVGANQSGDKFTVGDFDALAAGYRPWVGRVSADGVTISGPAYQPSGDSTRDYFNDVAVNEATGRVYAVGYSYQGVPTYWDPDGSGGPLPRYNYTNPAGIGTAVVYNSDWSIAHYMVWESDTAGEGIYDCVATADGGVIMVGGTDGNMPGHAGTNPGGTDTYIAKYNAAGALVWDYQSGDPGDDSGGDLRIDTDGNIYVAGNETNPVNGTSDPYVMKLKSDGTVVWKAAVDSNGTVDSTQDVGVYTKEKVYVLGRANPYSAAGGTTDPNLLLGTPWVPINKGPDGNMYVPRGDNEVFLAKLSPGDFTGDGFVDFTDVQKAGDDMRLGLGGPGVDTYDFDGDGKSDYHDAHYMIANVMDRLVGDIHPGAAFDEPGDVDNADIGKAAGSFTGSTGAGKVYFDGDMDFDGDVDNADVGFVAGEFTGALAGVGGSGPGDVLIYDPVTGNVKLDADEAGGDVIKSFQFETDGEFAYGNYQDPTNGGYPGALKELGLKVIADTSMQLFVPGGGCTGVQDLGNIFPLGMDLAGLRAFLTTAVVTGELGTGQLNLLEGGMYVIPEPATLALLGLGGLGAVLARRRRRR